MSTGGHHSQKGPRSHPASLHCSEKPQRDKSVAAESRLVLRGLRRVGQVAEPAKRLWGPTLGEGLAAGPCEHTTTKGPGP